MTNTKRTAPAPKRATPAKAPAKALPDDDPLGYEERASWRERMQLGLRPIAYDDSQYPDSHPDQRECPPWCWVAEQRPDEDGRVFGHFIEPHSPMMAYHSRESVSIVASRYRGSTSRAADRSGHVATATIESHLEQNGQSVPVINVALRWHNASGEPQYDPHRLRLSLTDAEELCIVLTHLVSLAES